MPTSVGGELSSTPGVLAIPLPSFTAEDTEYELEVENTTNRTTATTTDMSRMSDVLSVFKILPRHSTRKCLVIDLDETLIHSTYAFDKWADIITHVVQDNRKTTVYAFKRPGVDDFLINMAQYYDLVLFTAARADYADPIVDQLDPRRLLRRRLYRESCSDNGGQLIKDLGRLVTMNDGLDMGSVLLLDNSTACTRQFEENSLLIDSWFGSREDTALYDITPSLIQLSWCDDVRKHLAP